ncbi:glycoside hydrolase family 2 TIM barrel-domain containing protein [Ferruginibacter paludis]|uniref:glycoside hydrolase family 2 TIM barrel-domain containing protein n=1 Tax=Ferruginibacter paludis TaxID=1310417 RepID=UPI0025B3058D|nr:glycoside hydrolase family 2 TIM barrel-domain containing protein [Ferruginibacter paludis]MDN3656613.1 glycoside hydrolase family 2 TIM barrel-domain containing protein [Ferruginibacter paludis]
MKKVISGFYFLFCVVVVHAQRNADGRTRPFDDGWHFIKDSITGAQEMNYDDSKWRTVNLPHDWSIEDLPNQKLDTINGPFDRKSVGQSATGFTVGGTGWYRKKFTTAKADEKKLVTIHFDGVYMNSDVWLNGHLLGNHPYGYTPFYYDLTPYLNPSGQENVLVVKVQNEGKNSRWYSGSGIYRHVWLTVTEPLHVVVWGVYITTPVLSKNSATIQIKSTVNNEQNQAGNINLVTTILSPSGKAVTQTLKALVLEKNASKTDSQNINVSNPLLWSLDAPELYKVVTEIKSGNKTIDRVETNVGIRSIRFDADKGFLLNGKRVILKGGCIHHDNGPLGAAAIDRAEERKIELLKKVGYNAIRLSHNPPSQQLLDACDRLGMLVVNEAFDMWELSKNQQDYHLYFKEWWQKDLDAMLMRDRNHPSVIMWSIGNEIFEAPDTAGYRMAKMLSNEVRKLDATRAVTAGIVYLPGYTKKPFEDYAPYLLNLDVDGYNYFLESQSKFFVRDSATAHRFETEHAKHPKKTFIVTEYTPQSALENYEYSIKNSYMLGSFKWTAMDYIGEAGIGRPVQVPASRKLPTGLIRMGLFYMPKWSVFNAFCGDLDLIGNKKQAAYYQDVVWKKSPVEMLVRRPIADDMQEVIAPWGFPDELKSWTWPGQEGRKILVHVYTRSKHVKLELNGKVIAEQAVPDTSITATFEIAYQPGKLVAKSFDGDKETGSSTLATVGKPVTVRLTADRSTIKANTNDLAYVSATVVDEKGNVVPYIDDMEITYQLTGNATIAGVGNGSFDDASSFQQNHKKVYQGRGLVIIRPKGVAGNIILKATAKGLAAASIKITMK